MDFELERRWRDGREPFDGVIVRLEKVIPLSLVRRALVAVVEVLEAHWPETRLCLLHDWHQHDGVIFPPHRICSWPVLEEMLASDDTLYTARTGDTDVRIGLYPEDNGFYLRIYPEDDWEADDPPRSGHLGDFDLTCSPSLAAAVLSRLAPLALPGLLRGSAKAFFDAHRAGEQMTRRPR